MPDTTVSTSAPGRSTERSGDLVVYRGLVAAPGLEPSLRRLQGVVPGLHDMQGRGGAHLGARLFEEVERAQPVPRALDE